jgi:hypothetical protein
MSCCDPRLVKEKKHTKTINMQKNKHIAKPCNSDVIIKIYIFFWCECLKTRQRNKETAGYLHGSFALNESLGLFSVTCRFDLFGLTDSVHFALTHLCVLHELFMVGYQLFCGWNVHW